MASATKKGSGTRKGGPVSDQAGNAGERPGHHGDSPREDPPARPAHHHEVPRWRKIEILRERKALRDLLDDLGDEDVELDDEIFGFAEDEDSYFRAVGEEDDAPDEALDGDDFDDEDYADED